MLQMTEQENASHSLQLAHYAQLTIRAPRLLDGSDRY
jgi:hypothetical protein